MSWNYRVIEFVDSDSSPYRSIHEVHYDENNKPTSYGETAAIVQWDLDEENSAAASILEMMKGALDLPVLVEADFFK
jgi:hypothetical protein